MADIAPSIKGQSAISTSISPFNNSLAPNAAFIELPKSTNNNTPLPLLASLIDCATISGVVP